METIADRCRGAKKAKNISNQKVSELSGVGLSTVNNFFRAGQRSPSIDTVGPICKVLDVSLDRYFGIETPERELSEHEQALLEKDLSYERQKIKMLEESNRQKTRMIYLLFALCAALSLLLGIYLSIG